TARCIDEIDLDGRADVRAAGPRAGTAEQVVAEERREEIGEAPEVEVAGLEAAAPQAGVAVAVVELARLGLGQPLVGLDALAEALLRIRRLGDVGVQLAGERPEGLLDLRLARVARDAEELVVVALGRRHVSTDVSGRRRPTRRTATAPRRPTAPHPGPFRSPSARGRRGSRRRARGGRGRRPPRRGRSRAGLDARAPAPPGRTAAATRPWAGRGRRGTQPASRRARTGCGTPRAPPFGPRRAGRRPRRRTAAARPRRAP